jgi:hypothetical protein
MAIRPFHEKLIAVAPAYLCDQRGEIDAKRSFLVCVNCLAPSGWKRVFLAESTHWPRGKTSS